MQDIKKENNLRPVSVIIPTSARKDILRKSLPSYFAQWGVAEIILVNDTGNSISEWLYTAFSDPPIPVKLIEHPRNLGLCAARNTGIMAAKSEYIMMGEDDVIFSEQHIERLFEEGQRVGADIISGVIYRLMAGESFDDARARSKRDLGPPVDLKKIHHRTDPNVTHTCETFMSHALILTKSELAKSILYNTNFSGPTFVREDNEFSFAARRLGAKIFICPEAEAYHLPRSQTYGSGCRSDLPFITQALSMAVNNCLFIDRYFDQYQKAGYRGGKALLKIKLIFRDVKNLFFRQMKGRSRNFRRIVQFKRKIVQ